MAPARTCRRHPDQPARWQCGSCRILLCNDCVKRQRLGDMKYYECPTCGGTCQKLQRRARRSNKPRSFYELLPTAFGYPFTGTGFLVMVVAGLAALIVHHFGAGLLPVLVGVALLVPVVTFVARVAGNTSHGDTHIPVFPAVHNVFEDMVKPLLLVLSVAVMWFAAALVYYLASRGAARESTDPKAVQLVYDTTRLLALIAGPFFLAHLAVVGRLNSAAALNPLLPLVFIARAFMGWLLVSLVFLVMYWLIEALVPILYSATPSPYIATVASGFVVAWASMVMAHAIGLLYFSKSARLDFDQI